VKWIRFAVTGNFFGGLDEVEQFNQLAFEAASRMEWFAPL
jgi:hypothetical protein